MKKLILIDGNAMLHRAYHALPPLTNKAGLPTNAVYGFFTMLFKVITDLKPEYLIVCFDRKAPTFRKQMYVGYQAKRPTMSDDLVPQVDIVHKSLDKARISHYGIDGYEADDLIGTISKQAVEKGLEVIILSGDRDLLQLVNSHVLMLAPVVGITNMALFDEAKVKEKYKLNPSQFIDYKALVGDNSDNYPGVLGIGPKTAADLLNKYQTLENLYSHISELPIGLAEKLANDAEQAALAHAAAHGEYDIVAIVVTGNETAGGDDSIYPCHMCKQLLWESYLRSKQNTEIILANEQGNVLERLKLLDIINYPWPKG